MDCPEELLDSPYRKTMWERSVAVIEQLEKVLPIASAHVLGSFTTEKPRPADVDFLILLETDDETDDEWSCDFVISPGNAFGKATLADARQWMEEKYGKNNYQMFRLK